MNDRDDRTLARAAWGLVVPAIGIAAWQIAAGAGNTPDWLVAPSVIARSALSLIASGELWVHARDSLLRAYAGFSIGASAGVLIGLSAGMSRRIEGFFDPLVSLAYPVPKIAVLPILMVWLGLGDASKIAVIALGVFFPTYINAYYGAKGVPKLHLWSARNMGASRLQTLLKVVVPAAAPQTLTGLRIGIALAFIVLFAAEMVASKTGLGYLIIRAEDSLRYDLMYAAILTIGALGFANDRALAWLRARLHHG